MQNPIASNNIATDQGNGSACTTECNRLYTKGQRPAVAMKFSTFKEKEYLLDKKAADLLKLYSSGRSLEQFILLLSAFSLLFSRCEYADVVAIDIPRLKLEPTNSPNSNGENFQVRINVSERDTLKSFFMEVSSVLTRAYRERGESSRDNNDPSSLLIFAHDIHREPTADLENSYSLSIGISSMPEQSGIHLKVRYNVSMFDEWFIDSLIFYVTRIVEGFGDLNAHPLSLAIISQLESEDLFRLFNPPYDRNSVSDTVLALFDSSLKKFPHNIALICGEHQKTYRQLESESNQYAHYFSEVHGVKKGDFAGIWLEKSDTGIQVTLALIKLGVVFVPINDDIPKERLRYILSDAGIKILITSDGQKESIDLSPLKVITVGDLRDALRYATSRPLLTLEGTDRIYMVYTSGSTGTPKGIILKHQGFHNLIDDVSKKLGLVSGDRILHFFPSSADPSVQDIFLALANGAALVIFPNDVIRNVRACVNAIDKFRVTVLDITPSFLSTIRHDSLMSVRIIIVGGEVANPVDAQYCARTKAFYNAYGPSEATVMSTLYRVDAEDTHVSVPIGRPVSDKKVLILDDHNNILPVGFVGELHLLGPGLAEGYHNLSALTSERFIRGSHFGGELMYKTGDLVRGLPSGIIEFVGRKDTQLKLGGHRVEPIEVEVALLRTPAIKEASVVPVPLSGGSSITLVAFYTTHDAAVLDEKQLLEGIADYIPSYMKPSRVIHKITMPFTPTGKIDRRALAEEHKHHLTFDREAEQTVTEMENQIRAMCQRLLGVSSVGVEADLFALGLHSLTAMELCGEVYKQFQVELKYHEVVENASVKGLTRLVDRDVPLGYEGITRVQNRDYFDLSFAQRRLWITFEVKDNISDYNIPMAFHICGAVDPVTCARVFDYLIDRHESLRTRFVIRDGVPYQQIDSRNTRFQLKLRDLQSFQDPDAEVKRQLLIEATHSFDLQAETPLRAVLFRIANDEWVFFINVNHILTDGWSMETLAYEFHTLYAAMIAGKKEIFEHLPFQYRDFAAWQNNCTTNNRWMPSAQYWAKKLAGFSAPLKIPVDKTHEDVKSQGEIIKLQLDSTLVDQLNDVAKNHSTTLYTIILTAYNVLLYRYSGQEDIIIGTPVAGREHPSLNNQVGFYVNVIPLRTTIRPTVPLSALLKETTLVINEDLKFSYYPFELMLRDRSDGDAENTELFCTGFTWNTIRNLNVPESLWQMEQMDVGFRKVLWDLWLFGVWHSDNTISISFEYNKSLFYDDTVSKMMDRLITIIRTFIDSPEIKIMDIQFGDDIDESHNHSIKSFDVDLI